MGVTGIDLAIFTSSDKIIIRSNSQLVVGQVNGEYETKRHSLFLAWKLEHVSRDSNEKADSWAAVAVSLPIKETVLLPVYYQLELSIITNRVNEIDEACPS